MWALLVIIGGRKGCAGGEIVGEEDSGGGVGISVREGGDVGVGHALTDLAIAL